VTQAICSGSGTAPTIAASTREAQHQKVEFYLDSLVDTGELKKINYEYVLTGNALRAIEEYEEQERKHTESVKIQWRMFWLTLVIALLTFVQAGLVKMPALIDLSTAQKDIGQGITLMRTPLVNRQ
jgi:hypothetical protein